MRRIALILAILLSGCFGGGGESLSQEEAELRAKSAVEGFVADFASEDGGDLRRIHGEFSAMDLGDGGFSMGDVHVDLDIEWGTGDAIRMDMSTKSGGFSLEIGVYCDPSKTVILYGADVYESRPSEELGCGEFMGEGDEAFQIDELEQADQLNVTRNPDGTITAVYEDEEGRVEMLIDRQGRVSRMDVEADEGSGFLVVEYGKRRALEAPDATDRIPITMFGYGSFISGAYTWNAGWSGETAPYDEIEVRIMQDDELIATLPAGQDTSASGFTIDWTDDGDGLFGGNDTFTITSDSWTSSNQYEVVVWDTWADAEVGDVPIPGIGLPLLVAFLALVALRRR